MAFKRFVAVTARDAMRQVRQELGDEAVILSSKKIAGGHCEILAAAADAVDAMVEDTRRPRVVPPTRPAAKAGGVETFQDYLKRQGQHRPGIGASTVQPAATRSPQPAVTSSAQIAPTAPRTIGSVAAMYEDVANAIGVDASTTAEQWWDEAPALARRPAVPAAATARTPARLPARGSLIAPPVEPAVFRRRPTRTRDDAVAISAHASAPAMPLGALPAVTAAVVPAVAAPLVTAATGAAAPVSASAFAPALASSSIPAAAHALAAVPQTQSAALPLLPAAIPAAAALGEIQVPQPVAAGSEQLMAELQSLRAALQDQLNSISTSVAADSLRRNPLMARLMTRLLTAGFSADVARRVAQHAPGDLQLASSQEWLESVIAMNLKCIDSSNALADRTGVFALVGPTGVGKTTTVAKLAARFAVKYGTNSLGLITLDTYRVAAQEQLRAYGRILGTPVHLAQDGATLRELLASMRGKRLVLIDTCGVGPRDERLNEMLAMLSEAGCDAQRVQPVLLLNAGSHIETLDETARAWRAQQAAGCILTKLDEAARVGGALDCALRYKLTLLGLTNGQRVPEDLHLPNAKLLAHLALKPGGQAFALAESEATALAVAGA
jgi:flagellar biosynthesis protein FlhF